MRRKFFILAAGASAVVFIATAVTCLIPSRTVTSDEVFDAPPKGMSAGPSGIWWVSTTPINPPLIGPALRDAAAEDLRWLNRIDADYDLGKRCARLGFRHGRMREMSIEHDRLRLDGVTRYVVIPYWAILAAAGILPGFWLGSLSRQWFAQRRDHRAADGRCPACGYALRATPERCPECGTVPTFRESA